MAELVYASDLKSDDRNIMRVQFSPVALFFMITIKIKDNNRLFCYKGNIEIVNEGELICIKASNTTSGNNRILDQDLYTGSLLVIDKFYPDTIESIIGN